MTGASGGLGEEVAAAYAERGCAVVLSARRRRELDRVAARCREAGAPTAEVVPLDQGDAASVERALRGALAAPLDVVVLCGGVGAVWKSNLRRVRPESPRRPPRRRRDACVHPTH